MANEQMSAERDAAYADYARLDDDAHRRDKEQRELKHQYDAVYAVYRDAVTKADKARARLLAHMGITP